MESTIIFLIVTQINEPWQTQEQKHAVNYDIVVGSDSCKLFSYGLNQAECENAFAEFDNIFV